MLAFYSIIIEPNDEYTYHEGSLHNPPPELRDRYRIQRYLSISKDGWNTSEFGYLCYRKTDRFGRVYLLPALLLSDGPKPTKNFWGYKAKFEKKDIENYLQTHLERNSNLRSQVEEEMTNLVHDLRHLSTAIYHSAEQAERAFRDHDRSELADGLKTIVATQTMLKSRIDYLDYASGIARFEESTQIPVYSRVDKVVRCFKAAAQYKNISLRLSGESFRFSSGPNILDIVPYVLIDNAIKYSPKNYEVTVGVYDLDASTVVTIGSVGPEISDQEIKRIFDRGFRGANAHKIHSAGTGIGLSVAAEIVEKFSGEISASCSGDIRNLDRVVHRDIEFVFRVPSRGEDQKRRRRSRIERRKLI